MSAICGYGSPHFWRYSFAGFFAPVAGEKAIKNTVCTLTIRTLHYPGPLSDLDGCTVLYAGAGMDGFLPGVLTLGKEKPILAVSSRPDFAEAGGVIGLVGRSGKLRLDAQPLRNADAVIDDQPTGGQ